MQISRVILAVTIIGLVADPSSYLSLSSIQLQPATVKSSVFSLPSEIFASHNAYAASNKTATTTTLTYSTNPSTPSQQVTFTATISPSNATGTVTFTIDGTTQSPVTISGGTATLSTASLSSGSHTITAAYSGDANDAPSTSSALTAYVRSTGISVYPNPASGKVGVASLFKTYVFDSSGGTASAPAGMVSWSDNGAGGAFNGTCTLADASSISSSCSVTYTPAKTGAITISANYLGDGIHGTSSGSTALTSYVRSTGISVYPNPASGKVGVASLFKTYVFDSSGGTASAPAGMVSWSDNGAGGAFNGTCTLGPTTSTISSTCTISYTPASAGPITITATYSGDNIHGTSSGSTALTSYVRSTGINVAPNPASGAVGVSTALKVIVFDSSGGTASAPSGMVSWSGVGGAFGIGACSLCTGSGNNIVNSTGIYGTATCTLIPVSSISSACVLIFIPAKTGTLTISANYLGDGIHGTSSGSTILIAS